MMHQALFWAMAIQCCAKQTKFLPSWSLHYDRNKINRIRYLICKKVIKAKKNKAKKMYLENQM